MTRQTASAFEIVADLPGLASADVKMEVVEGGPEIGPLLKISGERKKEEEVRGPPSSPPPLRDPSHDTPRDDPPLPPPPRDPSRDSQGTTTSRGLRCSFLGRRPGAAQRPLHRGG